MVCSGRSEEIHFSVPVNWLSRLKSYGLTVVHHSCGSIYPVIGDLFDLGVDVVHPIQALAADMQPEKLKQTFPDKGAFSVELTHRNF